MNRKPMEGEIPQSNGSSRNKSFKHQAGRESKLEPNRGKTTLREAAKAGDHSTASIRAMLRQLENQTPPPVAGHHKFPAL